MDIQEFPKMLYKGDVNAIVHSEAEDADARKDGWHDFGATPAPTTEPEAQATAGQEQAAPKAQARGKKAQADQATAGQEQAAPKAQARGKKAQADQATAGQE